jgi:hypothetical protein
MNVEGRNSIEFYGFKRQSAAIPSFKILRFAVGQAESNTRPLENAHYGS